MSKIISPTNPEVSMDEQQQMIAFANALKSAPDFECDSCKEKYFTQVYRIKHLSGLITGTGRDMVVPISVYACAACGHVNQYFLEKFATDGTEEVK